MGLIQASFKQWTLEYVKFSLYPLGVVMVSYHLLALLNACPTGLQSLTFWGLTFLVLDL